MNATVNPLAREPLYELVARVLRHNIAMGRLPPGLVLLEGPIASLMQTSRAPVSAALKQLGAEGVISRFEGRGYLAGNPDPGTEPLRGDLGDFALDISDDMRGALQTRGTWMHFYDQVEHQIAVCQVFGEYRVLETELASYLGVSRTVVRDMMGRLHERGLIRKNTSSHWVTGPLTAQTVKEQYGLRAILEPAALRLAAPFLSIREIDQTRARIADDAALSHDDLEIMLLETCLAKAPNEALVGLIRQSRLVLSAVNRALTGLGLPPDLVARDQYRMLFDLMAQHPIDSSAEFLREHLQIMARRNLARMKIVGVVRNSQRIPPYLVSK